MSATLLTACPWCPALASARTRFSARLAPAAWVRSIAPRDTRLGREVAIKVLPADVAADPERLARFEREAQAVSALNHPNIVTLHEVGTSDAGPYLVLERVEGQSLAQT